MIIEPMIITDDVARVISSENDVGTLSLAQRPAFQVGSRRLGGIGPYGPEVGDGLEGHRSHGTPRFLQDRPQRNYGRRGNDHPFRGRMRGSEDPRRSGTRNRHRPFNLPAVVETVSGHGSLGIGPPFIVVPEPLLLRGLGFRKVGETEEEGWSQTVPL